VKKVLMRAKKVLNFWSEGTDRKRTPFDGNVLQ